VEETPMLGQIFLLPDKLSNAGHIIQTIAENKSGMNKKERFLVI